MQFKAKQATRLSDLADRADVEVLLRRFYGRVFDDDTLAEPFADLRVKGLDSHLRVMCDFWETVPSSARASTMATLCWCTGSSTTGIRCAPTTSPAG